MSLLCEQEEKIAREIAQKIAYPFYHLSSSAANIAEATEYVEGEYKFMMKLGTLFLNVLQIGSCFIILNKKDQK